MATPLFTTIMGLLCTSISSVVTFLITKRKYNVEVDAQQIENISKSFDIYRKMMNESMLVQDKKIIMQDNKIKQLQKENDDLRREISNLQLQMAQLINSVCYDTSCRLRKTSFNVDNKQNNYATNS